MTLHAYFKLPMPMGPLREMIDVCWKILSLSTKYLWIWKPFSINNSTSEEMSVGREEDRAWVITNDENVQSWTYAST
jgi:hypothetical protein